MNRSRLQKIVVSCRTCDVSDSFYSTTSVRSFRVAHLDHEVVERSPNAPRERPSLDSVEGTQVREDGGRSRLLKVLVELVMLPSYSSPVFTITGIRDNMKSAFVQIVPPNQRDQVNETLERGKFLDSGSSDMVYVWEPEAVSFSDDARMAMNFGGEPHEGSKPAETHQADVAHGPTPVPPAPESPVSRETPEHREAKAQVSAKSGSEVSVLLALPFVPLQIKPKVEADTPAREVPSASLVLPDSGPKIDLALELETTERPPQANPEEDGNYLLVSKSWYVESGPKNMNEAVRISRILRPFRWKVEPAYTIGVIIDDLLSIETTNGEIGADMTKLVEAAGYRLSRVVVEKGKPVAWFMKESRA